MIRWYSFFCFIIAENGSFWWIIFHFDYSNYQLNKANYSIHNKLYEEFIYGNLLNLFINEENVIIINAG